MSDRVDLDEGTRLLIATVADALRDSSSHWKWEDWAYAKFPAHRDETLALREAVAKVRAITDALDAEGNRDFAHIIREALEGLPE